MSKKYVVAIVGASGAVGEEALRILENEDIKLPIDRLVLLASKRSAGAKVSFKGENLLIKETTDKIFSDEKVEIAIFCAGGSVSERYAKSAVDAGAVVIDNTSFFRMDPDVPLVVPEVNPSDITLWKKSGIIANPNCSTIQMVQVLDPLHKKFGIERVDVSTYQAVSGAGKSGMEELVTQMQRFFAFDLDSVEPKKFPHQIALNLFPHIDSFLPNGYTKEEMKMVNETNKIMHSNFEVSATCVRVPILRSHSESITIRFKDKIDEKSAKAVLEKAQSVIVKDDVSNNIYPMPKLATDTDYTYVGRIRVDNFDSKILHLFCVADQIRVGAATNALRIAKAWCELQSKSK